MQQEMRSSCNNTMLFTLEQRLWFGTVCASGLRRTSAFTCTYLDLNNDEGKSLVQVDSAFPGCYFQGVTKQLPEAVQRATAKIDEYARGMISGTGSTLFEELGLYYIGPLDGHNIDDLIAVMNGKLSWHVLAQAACIWA